MSPFISACLNVELSLGSNQLTRDKKGRHLRSAAAADLSGPLIFRQRAQGRVAPGPRNTAAPLRAEMAAKEQIIGPSLQLHFEQLIDLSAEDWQRKHF